MIDSSLSSQGFVLLDVYLKRAKHALSVGGDCIADLVGPGQITQMTRRSAMQSPPTRSSLEAELRCDWVPKPEPGNQEKTVTL
jgi:hypothetical protein